MKVFLVRISSSCGSRVIVDEFLTIFQSVFISMFVIDRRITNEGFFVRTSFLNQNAWLINLAVAHRLPTIGCILVGKRHDSMIREQPLMIRPLAHSNLTI
jgi:hypothetical protein